MNILKANVDPEFTELCNKLLQEKATLTAKVAALTKENHYLRKGNRVAPQMRIVQRAYASAQLLAMWHCAGFRTGRRASNQNGMSDRSWYAGRALLLLAGIYDWQLGFKTDNKEEIERLLAVAIEKATQNPASLLVRLPVSKQPKAFR